MVSILGLAKTFKNGVSLLVSPWTEVKKLINPFVSEKTESACVCTVSVSLLLLRSLCEVYNKKVSRSWAHFSHPRAPLWTSCAHCPVGWSCRIHRLHLCRGIKPLPNMCPEYDTENLMVRFQWCWSFGECGAPLHCNCSQVHSGPEWLYLIRALYIRLN